MLSNRNDSLNGQIDDGYSVELHLQGIRAVLRLPHLIYENLKFALETRHGNGEKQLIIVQKIHYIKYL